MRADRLQKLADHLKTVRPCNFDLSVYTRLDSNKLLGVNPIEALQELKCGTVACAMGMLPLVFPEEWTWLSNPYVEWDYAPILVYKPMRTSTEWSCGMVFFEISINQYVFLFMPTSYPKQDKTSALQVAARIEWLIANEDRFSEIDDWKNSVIPTLPPTERNNS